MSIKISHLYLYPVKSCAGIALDHCEVDSYGIKGDRRWMIVDQQGGFLSQRVHPQMALIQPELNGQKLTLKWSGKADCVAPSYSKNELMAVKVWKDEVNAHKISEKVDQWLSEVLDFKCHLVYFSEKSYRAIDALFSKQGEQVAFADGYPLLLSNESTLAEFNQLLSAPIPMLRFRPNIVTSGASSLQERDWRVIEFSDWSIHLAKPCARCVMTGVDPATGVHQGNEPLRTLKSFDQQDGKPVFGINGIPRFEVSSEIKAQIKQLKVGDTLNIKNNNSVS